MKTTLTENCTDNSRFPYTFVYVCDCMFNAIRMFNNYNYKVEMSIRVSPKLNSNWQKITI